MRSMHREPSTDASYQVSVHLTKRFQRRRLKYEKLMDDGRQVMAKAYMAERKIREKKIIFGQQNKIRVCEFSWFTGVDSFS